MNLIEVVAEGSSFFVNPRNIVWLHVRSIRCVQWGEPDTFTWYVELNTVTGGLLKQAYSSEEAAHQALADYLTELEAA